MYRDEDKQRLGQKCTSSVVIRIGYSYRSDDFTHDDDVELSFS